MAAGHGGRWSDRGALGGARHRQITNRVELRGRVAGETRIGIRLQCSPYHTKSALWPVIRQLARAAGLEREASAEASRDKLAALLAEFSPEAEAVVPLLAELLGLPIDKPHPALSLDPVQKKRRIFRTLLLHLENLARRQPLLMMLEDAQWLDPTSRELFEAIVEDIARLPVLLVVTTRPYAASLWSEHSHVTTLTLNRLVGRYVDALVCSVAGARALPAEVVDRIRRRTDGIPLFVEELTKTVLESGALRDAGNRLELVARSHRSISRRRCTTS